MKDYNTHLDDLNPPTKKTEKVVDFSFWLVLGIVVIGIIALVIHQMKSTL